MERCQEMLGSFINLSSEEHGFHKLLNFWRILQGGVCFEFFIIGMVIQLTLCLLDVIVLAEHHDCQTFVGWIDYDVGSLLEFSQGFPVITRKVVMTTFHINIVKLASTSVLTCSMYVSMVACLLLGGIHVLGWQKWVLASMLLFSSSSSSSKKFLWGTNI